MSAFNHGAFIKDLRVRRGKIPQDLYDAIMASLAVGLGETPAAPAPVPTATAGMLPEPVWTTAARAQMGLKEIPGPKHNPKIVDWFAAAKSAWFKDDETPWCGAFQAYAMLQAGVTPPKEAVRAKAWASWGVACKPQVGAIGVKSRQGGGHVFQIVGITKDGRYYKCLGGNQNNMVSIIDIAVAVVTDIRWPSSVPQAHIKLPIMAAGTIGASEG